MASLNSIPKTETKRKSFFSGKIPGNEEVNVEETPVVQTTNTFMPEVTGLVQINIEQLVPHEHQSRRVFEDAQLEELTNSIKANGVITPLKVVRKGSRYEVASGERRLRAAKKAGLSHLPCIIIEDKKGILESVIENLQRENLNLIEEGRDYWKLLNTKVFETQKDLADNLGISMSRISECLSFYENIPTNTQEELIKAGKVSRKDLRNVLKGETNKAPVTRNERYFINIEIYNGKVNLRSSLPENMDETLKNELTQEFQKSLNR